MLIYGTFRAGIQVDGAILPTYDVETSFQDNTVTCWIASEAGKTFSVVWQDRDTSRSHSLLGDVTIDGVSGGGGIIRPLPPHMKVTGLMVSAELKYINTSVTTAKPLAFSKLQLTDEDEYLHSTPSGLGEIVLTLRPGVVVGPGLQPANGPNLNNKVHERSKKAFTHCIGFGDEIQVPMRHTLQVQHLTPKPSVTFVFRYRPLDRLIADGIVPSPPSLKRAAPQEEPEEEDQPHAPSDDDAIRELAALKVTCYSSLDPAAPQTWSQEQVKRLEARLMTSRKPSAKRVKVEHGDVIDLTC
ncbi:hypothetical protein F5I97DRAFT_1929160 [Phlebopus sp. FC_14]|nr:hypothetical protein F5I97DRAFT_1929160 [Phlebopus sp. FC_14]